jgi:hypothetical protein
MVSSGSKKSPLSDQEGFPIGPRCDSKAFIIGLTSAISV